MHAADNKSDSLYISPFHLISHLVAEEFVQVSQLSGVGDLTVQRHVPLRDPRGPADPDGGVPTGSPAALPRCVVRFWSVAG